MAVCWRKQRFQLTAARRRLAPRPTPAPPHHDFNSQPREGGWLAAMSFFSCPPPHFNSQPREGGWRGKNPAHQPAEYFNSQPREGGWLDNFINTPMRGAISTHSRAKAAGLSYALLGGAADISTHSRAKAAGQPLGIKPKMAAFQLTAARRRLGVWVDNYDAMALFQLTAARRRLGANLACAKLSHPFQLTAARRRLDRQQGQPQPLKDFNSQPREGGWADSRTNLRESRYFNSQPREGGWAELLTLFINAHISTHSRAKAAG